MSLTLGRSHAVSARSTSFRTNSLLSLGSRLCPADRRALRSAEKFSNGKMYFIAQFGSVEGGVGGGADTVGGGARGVSGDNVDGLMAVPCLAGVDGRVAAGKLLFSSTHKQASSWIMS